MNTNKKILLGSKDIVSKDNEDIYLDVELLRTVDEINKERINNNFNLSDEFNKERNNSLKFCVYGTIESKISDTTGLTITISSVDNDIFYSPKENNDLSNSALTYTITTIPLSNAGTLSKNAFNYQKSSYFFLFEIDRTELEKSITVATYNLPHIKYLKLSVDDQTKKLYDYTEIPFLYIDINGNVINFGTETTELDEFGNTVEINNNFPYLFDRHWVKGNFNITRYPNVFFTNLGEKNTITVFEGDKDEPISVDVSLDYPSKYGRESVQIRPFNDNTVNNPNEDYELLTTEIKWNTGETVKNCKINIIGDLYVESAETVSFELCESQNVYIGDPGSFKLIINDNDTPAIAYFKVTFLPIVNEKNPPVTLEIGLTKATGVPNQYVEVALNQTETTCKNVNFTSQKVFFDQDKTSGTFTINIPNNPEIVYVDTYIVFDIIDSSQNIQIGNSGNYPSKFTITVKDIYKQYFANFVVPGDKNNGYGIFKEAGTRDGTTYYGRMLRWEIDNISTSSYTTNTSFTDYFKYGLQVINNGESVKILDSNGKYIDDSGKKYNIYNTGDIIYDFKDLFGGFNELSLKLPGNTSLIVSNLNRYYKEADYTFVFTTDPLYYDVNSTSVPQNFKYESIGVNTKQDNRALDVVGNNQTYYLQTSINNMYTRHINNDNCNPDGIVETSSQNTNNVSVNGLVFLTSVNRNINFTEIVTKYIRPIYSSVSPFNFVKDLSTYQCNIVELPSTMWINCGFVVVIPNTPNFTVENNESNRNAFVYGRPIQLSTGNNDWKEFIVINYIITDDNIEVTIAWKPIPNGPKPPAIKLTSDMKYCQYYAEKISLPV